MLSYCFSKVTPDTEMNYWENLKSDPVIFLSHTTHCKNYNCHASHPARQGRLQKLRKVSHQTQNETQSQATLVEQSWPLAECSGQRASRGRPLCQHQVSNKYTALGICSQACSEKLSPVTPSHRTDSKKNRNLLQEPHRPTLLCHTGKHQFGDSSLK